MREDSGMGDRVLVRQVMTTVDTEAGTQAWLDDGDAVQGMVAGGYWVVVDRQPSGRKAKADGVDPA